ncbi:MAG TPA: phage tail protein [Polyangium sp.]|nr:phage tail protein [Polyangium sp.]
MSENNHEGLAQTQFLSEIVMGFRFIVSFFAFGVVPNPLDIRFQKVRGFSAEVETTPLQAGGQNLYTQRLPTGITYGNLVLERGLLVGSPLAIEINVALSLFRFTPSNVLVTLHNTLGIPISAWLFVKAYPVKWTTADLDANDKNVLIETIELAYSRMQIIRI